MKEFVVSVYPDRIRDYVSRHPVTRRDYFYYTNRQETYVWPVVFCDDEESAKNVAEILSAQYPACQVLVSRTYQVVQNTGTPKFTRTKMTPQGLLPE